MFDDNFYKQISKVSLNASRASTVSANSHLHIIHILLHKKSQSRSKSNNFQSTSHIVKTLLCVVHFCLVMMRVCFISRLLKEGHLLV